MLLSEWALALFPVWLAGRSAEMALLLMLLTMVPMALSQLLVKLFLLSVLAGVPRELLRNVRVVGRCERLRLGIGEDRRMMLHRTLVLTARS